MRGERIYCKEREMERGKYNRGGGAGRGRGWGKSVSGGGRDGSGGGRGGSGERAGNNYQQYHRQYQTGGGDGGRRGGWGGRNRNQMGPSPSPAQPWGYRGCKVIFLPLIVVLSLGLLWLSQRPQFDMGQGAGITGGTGVWSGGPPHVAGRGSSAPAVGDGAGAGHGQAPILPLFLFLSLKLIYYLCSPFLHALSLSPLITMLPWLPIGDEWRCSLLLKLQHQLPSHHHRLHMRLHWTISSTEFNPSKYSKVRSNVIGPSK